MQPNKSKATLQLVIATLLSLFGILLLGAAFVTAPPGEIHSSILIAYGEVMTFAGALFALPRTLPIAIPPAPPPQLLSILYPLATLYRLAILDLYIRTSPRPTSSPPYSTSIYAPRPDLLPHVLTLPSAALSTLPHSVPPLFRTHSPRPQHLTTILPHSFPLLLCAPSAPSSAEKFALPRLKQAVTHLWKSFVPKEEEDLSSTSYPDDIVWITL